MKESKSERFARIAEARVNRILDNYRLLGNCSHQGNYEYTDEQVERIFSKLRSELDATQRLFKTRTGTHKGVFSLSEPANEPDEEPRFWDSEIESEDSDME